MYVYFVCFKFTFWKLGRWLGVKHLLCKNEIPSWGLWKHDSIQLPSQGSWGAGAEFPVQGPASLWTSKRLSLMTQTQGQTADIVPWPWHKPCDTCAPIITHTLKIYLLKGSILSFNEDTIMSPLLKSNKMLIGWKQSPDFLQAEECGRCWRWSREWQALKQRPPTGYRNRKSGKQGVDTLSWSG